LSKLGKFLTAADKKSEFHLTVTSLPLIFFIASQIL